ncbi:MAG: hypothetical protein ACK5OA_08440 [Acidovorax sp.]
MPEVHTNTDNMLGRNRPSSTAWVHNQGVERVRHAMLASLAGSTGCDVARMNIRLRYACDIEALWYLRDDLFSTLSDLQGEGPARSTLDELTGLFQGQLPTTLREPLSQRFA